MGRGVWVSYGEGFRAPSVGELFFPFSGNSSLEPEESESVELGGSFRSARWTASVVAFECRAPIGNALDRIAARRERGDDPSEASAAIRIAQSFDYEPPTHSIAVDTTVSVSESLRFALGALRAVRR